MRDIKPCPGVKSRTYKENCIGYLFFLTSWTQGVKKDRRNSQTGNEQCRSHRTFFTCFAALGFMGKIGEMERIWSGDVQVEGQEQKGFLPWSDPRGVDYIPGISGFEII